MELTNIRRVGGCAIPDGSILSTLFEGDIIPVRLRATCRSMLSKTCNMDRCPRYRLGTAGMSRISWDNKGARI